MKILHTVEFYQPSVGGAQEVVRQLSEQLATVGHDVTVATTRLPNRADIMMKNVRIEEFTISGNTVKGLSGEVARYQELLTDGNFDIIMNYAAQQWATDSALPILNKISAKKVLVPCGFSGLFWPEYADYFARMKERLKEYDACVYHANEYRDIAFARECGANNDVHIPNGASAKEFNARPKIDIRSKLKIPSDDLLILHVGSHTGAKGHREAIQILKRARIKQACLLIVANDFGHRCTNSCRRTAAFYRVNPNGLANRKTIMIEELQREETVAAYHGADLFLFPSNIECSPLVLFESMASRTPFLTTDVGNAKEIIDWSGGGRLLPSSRESSGYVKANVSESARILEDLAADPRARASLGLSGHKAWTSRFTWEKIARDFEKLYESLLADGRIERDLDVSKNI